ncbi:YncE family protein, partial [Streptomyces sp. NPDC127084]|uniref:YncE family protein n=1 Tax=Streptomyces sp. NPDC127084 TaxID=3347133 RepID=UPI0036689553
MTVRQAVLEPGEAHPPSVPPDRGVRRRGWGGLLRSLVAGLVLVAGLALPVVASQPAHAVPPGTYAYVANQDDDTLSVIDTATQTVVATIPAGDGPRGVAVSPDGTRLYVANFFDDSVSVLDTATDTIVATVPVGDDPFGVAVSPDGTRVYLSSAADAVSVVDTATN